MSAPAPLYTTVDSVKVRLAGKVQFEPECGPLEDGQLPNALLLQLIFDAETEVEQDLAGRYKVPFQSKTTKTWGALPDHSRRAIRQVVDLKALINVIETDFGRGSHIDGSKYSETSRKQYDKMMKKLLGQDQEGESDKIDRFRRTRPLEDLALAPGNSEADDGYRGMIINTDMSTDDVASYAARQVNDPSKGWYGRRGKLP